MDILQLLQTILKFSFGSCFLYTSYLYLQNNNKQIATAKLGNKLRNGTDGIQISKNYTLSEKASQTNTVVIAPPGSGKTTSLFIPNLLQDNLKGSIIIQDPKGEIHALTHKYQESIGRKVIVYKPLEIGATEYNLLKECKNNLEIEQLAQSLLLNGALSIELQTGKKSGGVEWLQMAEPLLCAALIYAKDKNLNIKDAIELIIFNSDNEITEIFLNMNVSEDVKRNFAIYTNGINAKGMQSSIRSTLATNLKLFLSPLAINYTSFNAKLLREENIALYVQYDENKAYYLAPLIAPLYSQIINQCIDIKGNPIWCLFDEFANIGQLSNFTINITTARSREVAFLLCLQSFSQLKQIYGNDNALTIWNACKTKIALPSITDSETLRLFTEIIGQTEIKIKNNRTKKPLFSSDEIRRLKDNSCLIVSENFDVILDQQNTWYNQQKYKERIL